MQGQKKQQKVAISMRNSVLGRILTFLVKNTALWAGTTPNSSMENPILRTEFLFMLIYM
jgi:hypothetical protein